MKIDMILTVEQVACLLRVNTNTVRKLCKTCKLVAFKKLGKWFVYRSDVDSYIKTN